MLSIVPNVIFKTRIRDERQGGHGFCAHADERPKRVDTKPCPR